MPYKPIGFLPHIFVCWMSIVGLKIKATFTSIYQFQFENFLIGSHKWNVEYCTHWNGRELNCRLNTNTHSRDQHHFIGYLWWFFVGYFLFFFFPIGVLLFSQCTFTLLVDYSWRWLKWRGRKTRTAIPSMLMLLWKRRKRKLYFIWLDSIRFDSILRTAAYEYTQASQQIIVCGFYHWENV